MNWREWVVLFLQPLGVTAVLYLSLAALFGLLWSAQYLAARIWLVPTAWSPDDRPANGVLIGFVMVLTYLFTWVAIMAVRGAYDLANGGGEVSLPAKVAIAALPAFLFGLSAYLVLVAAEAEAQLIAPLIHPAAEDLPPFLLVRMKLMIFWRAALLAAFVAALLVQFLPLWAELGRAQDRESILRVLATVAGIYGSYFLSIPLFSQITRALPGVAAVRRISAVLAADDIARRRPPDGSSLTHPDPLRASRANLAAVAQRLDQVAARMTRKTAAEAPHPLAALLRASAVRLRDFLGSRRSLRTPLPADVRTTLIDSLALVIGSDPDAYDRVRASSVAFDDEGKVVMPQPVEHRRLLARVAGATARGIDPLHKVATAVPSIIGIGYLVFLMVTKRAEISDVLDRFSP